MSSSYILALDVGEKRIGAAIASSVAQLAKPLKTLNNTEQIWDELVELINKEQVAILVVGLPRNLSSKDTAQTKYVREFASKLKLLTGLMVVFQDEALTSRQAEAELRARGGQYAKGDIDALAATYILSDYLATIRAREQVS